MSQFEKLTSKVFSESPVTYKDAEKILFHLGFSLKIKGSHHIFAKHGYARNISIKRRKELLPYQVRDLKEILVDHGY